jgi:hypothetical protein
MVTVVTDLVAAPELSPDAVMVRGTGAASSCEDWELELELGGDSRVQEEVKLTPRPDRYGTALRIWLLGR